MTQPIPARPQAGGLPPGLSDRVKALALSLGFDLAGVARAESTPETEFLREWLARGYAGEMRYLERRVEERVDPRQLMAFCRECSADQLLRCGHCGSPVGQHFAFSVGGTFWGGGSYLPKGSGLFRLYTSSPSLHPTMVAGGLDSGRSDGGGPLLPVFPIARGSLDVFG